MSFALSYLLQGAAIGLTAAASPGPLQSYLITNSLSGGWRRGALVAVAPLISDPLIVLVIVLLLDQLPAGFLRAISLIGGTYVLFLAWGLLRQWLAVSQEAPGEAQRQVVQDSSRMGVLRKAVTMNFLSPGPYTFWMLVNGPLLLAALKQSTAAGIAFLLGFYGVFIGGNVAIAVIFDQARRLGPKVVRILLLASILILILFGVILLWQGIKG